MSLQNSLLHELRSISLLLRTSIGTTTFRDYINNVLLLIYINSLQLPTDSASQLGFSVSSYGLYLYDFNSRRGNLQQYRCTFYGIFFLLPELKPLLNRSKQTKMGWDRALPSRSPPPLSVTTFSAICAWLSAKGKIRASFAVYLGFHCFLIANEICHLHISDICFPNDARLSDFISNRAGCVFRNVKTSKNQYIPVSADNLLRRLRRFVSSKPRSASSLFEFSYRELNSCFHAALHHFRLSKQGYRLHSLCHGGATFEWMENTPLQDVMTKGRWEAESSCKQYLNAGKALLVRTAISS